MVAHSFGIVGFGRIGKLYLETLQAMGPDATVLGIADPALREASINGIPVFCEHGELLSTEAANIIVATPPVSHEQIGMDALRAGKNVLLEKPPARTTEGAQRMIDMSRRSGTTLFFGYHARYNRSVSKARSASTNAEIQRFSAAYKENIFNFHSPTDATSWVLKEGMLRDSGINLFSILAKVLTRPEDLRVTRAELLWSERWNSDMGGQVEMEGLDGARGVLELDWRYQGAEQRRLEMVTRGGEFEIDISTDTLKRDGRVMDTGDADDGGGMGAEYGRMLRDYLGCVENGASSCGLLELEWLDACYAKAVKRPVA